MIKYSFSESQWHFRSFHLADVRTTDVGVLYKKNIAQRCPKNPR
ncbi:MAG: hypothetical protein QOK81_07150 [Nitrososphaeraceae archaeon]|nr:hypothetical protein [Nitrososphaeraceae archaeon]